MHGMAVCVCGKQSGAALHLLASAVWFAIVLHNLCAQGRCVVTVKKRGLWEGSDLETLFKKGQSDLCCALIYQTCRLEEKIEPSMVLNYPLLLTTFYLSITEQARFGLHRGKLYLERGPERYVLAWSMSRAFSTTDGEETSLKRMLRRATPGFVFVYRYNCDIKKSSREHSEA